MTMIYKTIKDFVVINVTGSPVTVWGILVPPACEVQATREKNGDDYYGIPILRVEVQKEEVEKITRHVKRIAKREQRHPLVVCSPDVASRVWWYDFWVAVGEDGNPYKLLI